MVFWVFQLDYGLDFFSQSILNNQSWLREINLVQKSLEYGTVPENAMFWDVMSEKIRILSIVTEGYLSWGPNLGDIFDLLTFIKPFNFFIQPDRRLNNIKTHLLGSSSISSHPKNIEN